VYVATVNLTSSPIITLVPLGTVAVTFTLNWTQTLFGDNSQDTATVSATWPSGVTADYTPASFTLSGTGSAGGRIVLTAALTVAPTNGPVAVTISATVGGHSKSTTLKLRIGQGFYTGNGSVTLWQFFAAQAMDPASPEELATAPVRDPLWLLARQWQLKEFQGDDAGSAIQVRYLAQQAAVNLYAGGSAALGPFNGASTPIEAAVESEPVALSLRGAVQLGLRFEAMLADAQTSLSLTSATLQALVSKCRAAFPIASLAPGSPYDMRADAFSALAAGSLTNGWALYKLASTNPASPLIPAGTGAVVAAFVKWCQSIYVQPKGTQAWNGERVTYAFGVASTQQPAASAMRAPDFPGGRLDWYDFDLADSPTAAAGVAGRTGTSASLAVSAAAAAETRALAAVAKAGPVLGLGPPPTSVAGCSLPHHIRFAGMPEARYWNLEDGKLNLAAVQPNTTDIATLLVLEFALAYSNDWFVVTVPTPVGSLTQVVGVIVTDTFGIRTLIEPADGTTTGPGGATPCTAFTMSGASGQTDTVLLAPTLADVLDGQPIEDVWFARDDMAAMAWAEERRLQGPMDTGIDVAEDVLRREKPPVPIVTASTDADVAYVLGTGVPMNWIPMVPIPGDPLFRLRRGAMAPLDPITWKLDPITRKPAPIYPRGVVLRQDQALSGKPPMLLVRDSAIPPTGVQVSRFFRRARWIDGSTACWIGRRVTQGKGQANSGLAFDVLQKVGLPTAA
jgi:hypothetical protein